MATPLAPPPPEVASGAAIGPNSNGMSMTTEEFDAVRYEDCDPGFRYELVRGVLIVSPIPKNPHEAMIDDLGFRVEKYRREHPDGAACDGTLPGRYVETFIGRRIADRVVWCGLGRDPNHAEDVPTIAVEIVSERTRDRRREYLEKRAEHRDAGVAEYWIVDRFARTVTVVESSGTERAIGEQDSLTSPLLPGFSITPLDLFREAERWGS
ncbi:Uma2 family endonuclease [Alienimonas californiensis]|uniref:Putative restriction endonuclease domain-containing protein n=1 Tax=Alienimonas californiensis TaxID=2527989 RepID=A0A517PC67_9PLAN|nr:Uma2 family endonuclease [Alienimonas californiensis]QDT16973.1 hypothetical protein CA12_30830 [Alienimonas californiensis]